MYYQRESVVAIKTGGRKVFSILAALGYEALIVELSREEKRYRQQASLQDVNITKCSRE